VHRPSPPSIIIVGSFCGESAIHMAKLIKAQKVTARSAWTHGPSATITSLAPREDPQPFRKTGPVLSLHGKRHRQWCQDVIVPFAIDSIMERG
jgi:hypothetical protein